MKIPDKQTFKRLSARGLLGNTFRQWNSRADLRNSGYDGWVTQRAYRAGDSALFIPSIRASEVLAVNWDTSLPVYFQELSHESGCSDPTCNGCGRTTNLEAGFLPGTGLYVRHSHHPSMNLRHDLEQHGQDATGLDAFLVLYQHVPAEDLDTMRELWDLYPGSIIEASVFSRAVGIQNKQTIFWEVRNY